MRSKAGATGTVRTGLARYVLAAVLALLALSCAEPGWGVPRGTPSDAAPPQTASSLAPSAVGDASRYLPLAIAERSSAALLLPLVVRPTERSVTINVVAPSHSDGLRLSYRRAPRPTAGPSAAASGTAHSARPVGPGEGPWQNADPPRKVAADVVEWSLDGLSGGASYRYRVQATGGHEVTGTFVTQRAAGAAFSFALLTDTHVYLRDFSRPELAAIPLPATDVERSGGLEAALHERWAERAHGHAVLPRVAANMLSDAPDFIIHLGDVIDLHGFGFNVPVPGPRWARKGWLDYRWLLGPLARHTAHFAVMGNWDGEKGNFTEQQRAASRAQRVTYLPNPTDVTYPQGGSPHEDYYGFTWGDALFVVLNVISYTKSEHVLQKPAQPDDYTLGDDQLRWLERTLEGATARWRFVLIHHTVGGRGGDARNSAYGRGGGRAAGVGEQAKVHALMRKHGVQVMFYGHDHVFCDMVVDGIHYTLPGSAGAPWKFTPTETGYDRYWPDSGHARVRVTPEQVDVELVSVERRVLHRYSLPHDG
ncbi:MAG: metallophosphoesterase [Deltaproteobacteria bacterium]|nr:metallophosphoesterase [Deltaproteobacteria bacterium]